MNRGDVHQISQKRFSRINTAREVVIVVASGLLVFIGLASTDFLPYWLHLAVFLIVVIPLGVFCFNRLLHLQDWVDIDDYTERINNNPTDVMARIRRAKLWNRVYNNRKALEDYCAVMTLLPGHGEGYKLSAQLLLLPDSHRSWLVPALDSATDCYSDTLLDVDRSPEGNARRYRNEAMTYLERNPQLSDLQLEFDQR